MTLRTTTSDGVRWAVIDRPEALNAFDIPDLEALLRLFTTAQADPAVRVLVLTGTGRAFSVGADIKAMAHMSEARFAEAAALYQALARAARGLDKPILGAINGYALGGGLEVALMCDLRIAGASAQLGLPDAQLGFSPTGGLTWLLARIVGLGAALDMALSTEMLDAEAALRAGLVTRVVADDALEEVTREMATRLAAFPERGLRNIKRSFYMAAEADFASVLTLEEAYDSDCFRAPATQAALRAFIDSRRR